MKRFSIVTLALILVLASAPVNLRAAELAEVTLDDTLRIGERTLTLTGMGLRTKTFLKIKVYVAGLYMENPTLKASDIIGSDQAKAMVMSFVYKEVEGEKLQEAWREGFHANTPSAGPDLVKRMDQFISLFSIPAIKGDRYVFSYEPGKGTMVMLKDEIKATIPGADFASALMAIWFGDKLGDGGLEALKESILKGME